MLAVLAGVTLAGVAISGVFYWSAQSRFVVANRPVASASRPASAPQPKQAGPSSIPSVTSPVAPPPRESSQPAEKKPEPEAITKAPAPKAPEPHAPAPRVPAPSRPSFDTWLQDLEQAKRQAADENKDVLIAFNGMDWCVWCQKLAREVLLQPAFLEFAQRHFVLVQIDAPQTPAGKAKVQNPKRNEELVRRFAITGYPKLVLLDAKGRPYAGHGYEDGGVEPYLEDLRKLMEQRQERDRLLAAAEATQGIDGLAAASQALNFLVRQGALRHFGPEVAAWCKRAQADDPQNTQGYLERFYEANWMIRSSLASRHELPALVDEVGRWRKEHPIRDGNRAGDLLLDVARMLGELRRYQEALQLLAEGQTKAVTDPQLKNALLNGPSALGLGSGTGFAVGPRGRILTNAHVAVPGARLFVLLGTSGRLLPARVLAQDLARDIALLQVNLPEGVELPALGVVERPLRRGEEVAVLGFPLGHAYGAGLKMTRGGVSALPEVNRGNLLLLDVKVNPGNSGSPLCDAAGNVVGLVMARTNTQGGSLESYGVAVPGGDVLAFLKRHVKDLPTAAVKEARTGWEEVDRTVSPAVVPILVAPAASPTLAAGTAHITLGSETRIPGEPARVAAEGLRRDGRVGLADPKVRVWFSLQRVHDLPAKSFSVRLEGGKRYRMALKGEGIDAVLAVHDDKGRQRAMDDDSGGDLNSLLTLDVLADADYTVHAASLKGDGPFRLSVEEIGPVTVHDVGTALKLEGKLGPDAAVVYSVRLEKGKTYAIEMTSPDGKALDPLLSLETSEGEHLAEDDNSGGGLNARLLHRAEETGVYRVVATSFGLGKGVFSLKVRPASEEEKSTRIKEATSKPHATARNAHQDAEIVDEVGRDDLKLLGLIFADHPRVTVMMADGVIGFSPSTGRPCNSATTVTHSNKLGPWSGDG